MNQLIANSILVVLLASTGCALAVEPDDGASPADAAGNNDAPNSNPADAGRRDVITDVIGIGLQGCDTIASGATIHITPAAPVAPASVSIDVAMPAAWVYVALEVTGPTGSLIPDPALTSESQHGSTYTWSYRIPQTVPGLYCVTFTTDQGAHVRQRAVLAVGQ